MSAKKHEKIQLLNHFFRLRIY